MKKFISKSLAYILCMFALILIDVYHVDLQIETGQLALSWGDSHAIQMSVVILFALLLLGSYLLSLPMDIVKVWQRRQEGKLQQAIIKASALAVRIDPQALPQAPQTNQPSQEAVLEELLQYIGKHAPSAAAAIRELMAEG